ncbi:MAG: polysaccharide deacetylase family protein [Pseudomonadota bacterium]
MTTAQMQPNLYMPPRSLMAKVKRRLTQWQTAAPMSRSPECPVISFTFDDFPRSAAQHGAEILSRHSAKGAYYTCTGFMDQSGPGGPYFTLDDVETLNKEGHEIAAHTQTHLDCAKAAPETALADINENLNALEALALSGAVEHFAYPYGETQLSLKSSLKNRFSTCRGILPGVNRAGSDLMQLRAVELGNDAARIARAERMIEDVARSPGWLIFFTHDVQSDATDYGVTPAVLEQLVRRARDSGALLTTPSEALEQLSVEHA